MSTASRFLLAMLVVCGSASGPPATAQASTTPPVAGQAPPPNGVPVPEPAAVTGVAVYVSNADGATTAKGEVRLFHTRHVMASELVRLFRASPRTAKGIAAAASIGDPPDRLLLLGGPEALTESRELVALLDAEPLYGPGGGMLGEIVVFAAKQSGARDEGRLFRLRQLRATDLVRVLQQAPAFAPDINTAIALEGMNAILAWGSPEGLARFRDMIEMLDRVPGGEAPAQPVSIPAQPAPGAR